MMIKCLGTSFNFKASVEVMIRSLSIVIKGNEEGFEPVAMIIFLASKVSEVPSAFATATCVASTKEPKPSKTVTLFLSIKYLTPPEV